MMMIMVVVGGVECLELKPSLFDERTGGAYVPLRSDYR